jgi:aspartate-semialdehyde dehydrogenase
MIHETRKILGELNLPMTATTVRVPVFLSHRSRLTSRLT